MIGSVIAGYFFYQQINEELPDFRKLKDVNYQTPLTIYSKDDYLIAEFGEKKRYPIEIENVPKQFINAILSSEDANFYHHPGVDFKGLTRAGFQLLLTGKKKQGGSTITMQVTRNFLLSRKKTYTRKIKEIILALKIEREFTKNEILELYVNKIYLGHRSYGITAAAQTYYGKPLAELNLAQLAMIAGLPKAPSAYNPITNPTRALQRRNYVLRRMLELEHISQQEFDDASNQPVTALLHNLNIELSAPYLAEMVRQKIVEHYGEDAYTSGLKVYTSINKTLQDAAVRALRNTLHSYDERHGYRIAKHDNIATENNFDHMPIIGSTLPGIVNEFDDKTAKVQLQDQRIIDLPWQNCRWARQFKTRNIIGPHIKHFTDIFKQGDIIRVRQLDDGSWALAQIPETQGAFLAVDPVTGAIQAITGGYDFFHNKYNRVIQSSRQPGSGFKPIIYTTALEEGMTAASTINDTPVVVDEPGQETEWRPENYSHKFFGPTRLRVALRKSRNLISIRLLRRLGIERVTETALRFGFNKEQLPNSLSLALGSGHATPLQMVRVYSTFANGGFLIQPYFIERIENSNGEIVFQHQAKPACPSCAADYKSDDIAPRIISPQIHFLMNSLLRDVVQRGTAVRAKSLGRTDLAGKTGTTNDQRDAWFNGFNAKIAATAWVGFDDSKPMGRSETGSKAALPMWIEFMQTALENIPEQPLIKPEDITTAFINPDTGLQTSADNEQGIWEFFRIGNEPKVETTLFNSDTEISDTNEEPVEALF